MTLMGERDGSRYEPPKVEVLGSLEELTGATDSGSKNEGASVKT